MRSVMGAYSAAATADMLWAPSISGAVDFRACSSLYEMLCSVICRNMHVDTYIHTYIYLDLDAKIKASVFGNKSLGTYSMGNRCTGHI
jgi:hypothetical protein